MFINTTRSEFGILARMCLSKLWVKEFVRLRNEVAIMFFYHVFQNYRFERIMFYHEKLKNTTSSEFSINIKVYCTYLWIRSIFISSLNNVKSWVVASATPCVEGEYLINSCRSKDRLCAWHKYLHPIIIIFQIFKYPRAWSWKFNSRRHII